MNEQTQKSTVIESMHTYGHMKNDKPYYHHSRNSLSIGNMKNSQHHTLSCELLATNGDIPHRHVAINAMTTPGNGIPKSISLNNLTRPTQTLSPIKKSHYPWQLVANLSLNYQTLGDINHLKDTLQLFDWSGGEENKRRIEGIVDISVKPVNKIQKGALQKGLTITVTCDDDYYPNHADLYLFGTLLHHFFIQYAAINTVVETVIKTQSDNRRFQWQCNQALQPLI